MRDPFPEEFIPKNQQKGFFSSQSAGSDFFREKRLRKLVTTGKSDSTTKRVIETLFGQSGFTRAIGSILDRELTEEERLSAKTELKGMGVEFKRRPTASVEQKINKLYRKVGQLSLISTLLTGEVRKIRRGLGKGLGKSIALSNRIIDLLTLEPPPSAPSSQTSSNAPISPSGANQPPPPPLTPSSGMSSSEAPESLKTSYDDMGRKTAIPTKIIFPPEITTQSADISAPSSFGEDRDDDRGISRETMTRIRNDQEDTVQRMVDFITKANMQQLENFLSANVSPRDNDLREIVESFIRDNALSRIEPDEQQQILKNALIAALEESGIGQGGGIGGGIGAVVGGVGALASGGLGAALAKLFGKKASPVAGAIVGQGSESATKIGAKTVFKSALKKIPILGALVGTALALGRSAEGDYTGAGMELASGLASTLPVVGTAASLGIDAALLNRDLNIAPETQQIMEMNDENKTMSAPTIPVQEPKQAPVQNIITNNVVAPAQQQSMMRHSNQDNTFNRLVLQDIDHPSTYSNFNMG